MKTTHEHGADSRQDHKHSYRSLGIELAFDFVIMYLVMYTMIASLDHFHFNLNNAYMTLMMVTPMALLMLFMMRSMFPSRRLNLAIGSAAALVFLMSFAGMRMQAGVGNADFLRSMIPHHSGAILMCEEAAYSDPRIAELCATIVAAQREEIATMEAILDSY